MRWRRSVALTGILLLTLVGCSSGDDTSGSEDSQPASNQQDTADTEPFIGMDPNFDPGSLPDDFPTELVPNSFNAGEYFELGQVRTANYESSSSFDDVVAEYNAKTGVEPIIVEIEERIATWDLGNNWVVSVLGGVSDDDPIVIGITSTG